MRIHAGYKPYMCSLCQRLFSTRGILRNHEKTHSGEKSYKCKCDLCHKCFSKKDSLDIHMRTHTGERPYLSNLCHKTFSSSSALTMDEKTHNGDKSYKCDLCEQAFTRSDKLKCHRRTHAGVKKDLEVVRNKRSPFHHIHTFLKKPHGCGICDEMFQMEKDFMDHCYHVCHSSVNDDFLGMFQDQQLKSFL